MSREGECSQYLLRFDDLCPSMDPARWEPITGLLERYSISPILSVVPCNADPELEISEPDPQFWERMRGLQEGGATIGLHGYRHVCTRQGRGLLPLHRCTEFAGASLTRQRAWIRAGLDQLQDHGLRAQIWVAPRHGFDANTLLALREEGLTALSDGFTRYPTMRGGVSWIPQQLWEPERKRRGVWTICIHPNRASDDLVERLERFLEQHAAQFTSVPKLLAESQAKAIGRAEIWMEALTVARWRLRAFLRR